MKLKLSILFFLTVNLLYGQYDYFKWSKTNTNLIGVKVSSKSGIAVDIYNRCYYIDGISKKIRSMYGDVLTTASVARSNSNLIYKRDASAGDRLYYISNNNKMSSLRFDYSLNTWVVGTEFSLAHTVAPQSFIEIVDQNHGFYVRNSDFKVCDYWINSSGSGTGLLTTNALPATPTTNLVLKNNAVYYINNTNKLSYIKYNTSTGGWQATNLDCDVIAAGSKIQVDQASNQIFYVRASDNQICRYWINGSTSGYEQLNKLGVAVMPGSDLFVPSTNDYVVYIGTDGNFHNEYFQGCKWVHNRLNAACNIGTNYNSYAIDNSGSLYFCSSGNISNLSRPAALSNMVYRKGSNLEVNGNSYNAKIIDYCLLIYRRNGEYFIGPSNHYGVDIQNWPCLDPNGCNDVFNSHFQNIKSAGFNAIRFNGFQMACKNSPESPGADPKLYFEFWEIGSNGSLSWQPSWADVNADDNLSKIFELYEQIINKAAAYKLKTNVFAGLGDGQKIYNKACHSTYGTYLNNLADHFKTNPNILMYNLMLEADMHNNHTEMIPKDDICSTVNDWYEQIRSVDKNHLVSIGVNSNFALESFDPGILNVDVMTYHIYTDLYSQTANYSMELFFKYLKWFSNIMNDQVQKPWIVGETGVQAVISNPETVQPELPNDVLLVVDYPTQKNFALQAFQNIFLAGASGAGWWQYKDVFGAHRYFGIVDHNGNNKDIITGTSVFKTPVVKGCNESAQPIDYFNTSTPPYSNYDIALAGFVKYGNAPIPNACIHYTRYNDNGILIANISTYTDINGHFELRSPYAVNTPGSRLTISGIGMYTEDFTPPYYSNSLNVTYNLTPITCNSIYTKSMNSEDTSEETVEHMIVFGDNESDVIISPNPFTTQVTISFSEEQDYTTIAVLDMVGKEIKRTAATGKEIQLELNDLPKGIYVIQIQDLKNKVITKKIIAQ